MVEFGTMKLHPTVRFASASALIYAKNEHRGLSDRRRRNIAQWCCSATVKRETRTQLSIAIKAYNIEAKTKSNQGVRLLSSPTEHCPKELRLHGVHEVKEECLSGLIQFGEGSLHGALTKFIEHYRVNAIVK